MRFAAIREEFVTQRPLGRATGLNSAAKLSRWRKFRLPRSRL